MPQGIGEGVETHKDILALVADIEVVASTVPILAILLPTGTAAPFVAAVENLCAHEISRLEKAAEVLSDSSNFK